MCSLCITSITNINARLSAGGRGRTRISVRSVCICVAMCVNVSILSVYACSCKDSQKDSMRTRSDKRVDVVHATRRRKYISL